MNTDKPQFSQEHLESLANKIRVAGGKPEAPSTNTSEVDPKLNTRYRPDIGRVHMAVQGGHINVEEAVDLNPKYDPKKASYNSTQASKIRELENRPQHVRERRARNYAVRKAKYGR